MDDKITFVESRFKLGPLLEIAGPVEDSAAFLAGSWWRRTLINLAGGGKLVITKPAYRERKK